MRTMRQYSSRITEVEVGSDHTSPHIDMTALTTAIVTALGAETEK